MKIRFLLTAIAVLGLAVAGAVVLNNKPSVASFHAFEEPLVALGGDKSSNYDPALIEALHTYQHRKAYEDVSAITEYLDANPNSPWKFSLLANLGIVYRKTGHFTKALDAWEQAWALGKKETNYQVQALSNRAAAELALLSSSLGRSERLQPLFAEFKSRRVYGSSSAALLYSAENLHTMKTMPGISFKCGPYALGSIRAFTHTKGPNDKLIMAAQSSSQGFSLTQVRNLSSDLRMSYQMAKKDLGAAFIVPAVVNWKSGHYAALLKQQGDFYLTQDPTFGQQILVTSEALDDESSGYYLVPSGPLPSGWHTVSDAEGNSVWGRGLVAHNSPNNTKPDDKKCPTCSGGTNGMAGYNIFAMLISMSISDTPVGYSPPVGPDLHFTVTYNELEYGQPSSFSFFNFGPSWNGGWLSYVAVPTSTGADVTVYVRGGGQEIDSASTFVSTGSTYPGYLGYYGNEIQSQATLWVKAPVSPSTYNTYERRMPDGSKEIFAQGTSSSSPVDVFLTSIIDRQGNAVALGYDQTYLASTGNLRLATVTDGSGLTTQISYGLTTDPLKVTQITDPYARSATFSYSSTAPYQLTSITDPVGIQSSFNYGSGSQITSLVTPYGTTNFSFSWNGDPNDALGTRSLIVTEPDSSQVKAEFDNGPNYPYYSGTLPTNGSPCVTTEPVPVWSGSGATGDYGITSGGPAFIQYRNTYFWDKKAMQVGPNDYTKARIFHWLHNPQETAISGVLESEKPALENRIWYTYPGQEGQGITSNASIEEGTSGSPIAVIRVISNVNAPQVWQYQYNNAANPAVVTTAIDPLGRQTNFYYDSATGLDLLQVTQNTASGSDTLKTITYNNTTNPPHCPATVTDASGQTTSYAYNSQGQVTSITPPLRSGHGSETTTYNYSGNYLTSIVAPMAGATTTLTYDSLNGHTINRVKTSADPESYTLTYSYDNLDRVTQILYPDSTTETSSYFNPSTASVDLDIHSTADRLGRTTTRTYDSTRHLLTITNPKGDTTHYGWCSCGNLISFTDPNGNTTYLNRDTESRLTSKVYPGETQPPSSPDYIYDPIGRVSSYTDKRGNVATNAYNIDNTLAGVSYSLVAGTVAPPTQTYTYDTYYPRLTSAGGVSISYVPVGSLGGNMALSMANSLTGGTAVLTYAYDEWGRVVGHDIDGSNNETISLDSLGRVSSVNNLLGGFSYNYFDSSHPTDRVGSISYPNGQSTVYNYFGNTGDELLQEIKNLNSTGSVLSQNDYTYDASDKILTWKQQSDGSVPLIWTYGHDAVDELTSAVLTNTAISLPAVRSDSYGYDGSGNPTTFNVSGVTRNPSYNALNQLTGSTPSGNRLVGFSGTLTVAASVTVNGSAAAVNGSNYFSGTTTLTPGSSSTVSVIATDASGNARTNHYHVNVPPEPTYSPTFDNDGNELSDGTGRTFTWDAKNELVSISYSTGGSTVFTYDALGHRISESDNGALSKQWVWNGAIMADERNASNTVTKRFYDAGEQVGGTSYYYTTDHLGSVREVTNTGGAIQSRYDYDPFGRATVIQGTFASDFQFAGYYVLPASSLNLTIYRAYDPVIGRWLSRDPSGEKGGINLYSYTTDGPIDKIDANGLDQISVTKAATELTNADILQDPANIAQHQAIERGNQLAGGTVAAANNALTSANSLISSVENNIISGINSITPFPVQPDELPLVPKGTPYPQLIYSNICPSDHPHLDWLSPTASNGLAVTPDPPNSAHIDIYTGGQHGRVANLGNADYANQLRAVTVQAKCSCP